MEVAEVARVVEGVGRGVHVDDHRDGAELAGLGAGVEGILADEEHAFVVVAVGEPVAVVVDAAIAHLGDAERNNFV